jgi:hypothetical protein
MHHKGLKYLMLSFKELELVQLLLRFELSSPICKSDVKGIGAHLSTAGRLLARRCTPTNATFGGEKINPWGCHCRCPRHPSYFGDATTSSTRRPQKTANR